MHYHKDENGFMVTCYHGAKSILTDWKFFLGMTVSFPIEHFIWTKLPGFSQISEWMGLIH